MKSHPEITVPHVFIEPIDHGHVNPPFKKYAHLLTGDSWDKIKEYEMVGYDVGNGLYSTMNGEILNDPKTLELFCDLNRITYKNEGFHQWPTTAGHIEHMLAFGFSVVLYNTTDFNYEFYKKTKKNAQNP